MVIGPRQCGKTTLVRDLVPTEREHAWNPPKGPELEWLVRNWRVEKHH